MIIRDIYAVNIDDVEFNSVKVAGIYMQALSNYVTGKERHIRDVIVEDCYLTHTGKFGIYCTHEGGNQGVGNDSLNRNMNLVFRNNHFYETGGAGMFFCNTITVRTAKEYLWKFWETT